MGATRASLKKHRVTGGAQSVHRKKRKYELARPSASTKWVPGQRRVRSVRVRGGAIKWRALRLSEGNFCWGTETCAKKTRIIDVVYNASSNELVRTKSIVKGAIVLIDATPFRNWYERHYGVYLGKLKTKTKKDLKPSDSLKKKWAHRARTRKVDEGLANQFKSGRLLARISSRPGQVGHSDGYILEGKELEFYEKKMAKKKKSK
eukprot:TRINITY_DN1264_c0_g1_i1.p2 TRINITY_DN1264_c0_g1~~TRINITY_DN1264_c0_g1_i1.p2  ORF type:complete len:205 (-),score=55.34 TRINITY_DN1264_c0_g1_i1:989-1603(-)